MAQLDIQTREKEGITILDLNGRLAVGGASDSARKGQRGDGRRCLEQVILNLKDVDYIDSTGLGTMVICYTSLQKAGGALKLVQSQPAEHRAAAAHQAVHRLSDFQ